MSKGRPWSAEEDALLREWKADGVSNELIGARLGRGEHAVRAHWSDINRYERMRLATERRHDEAMGNALSEPRRDSRVPDHVWAERNARMSAPISVGGFVFGDPPFQWSAAGRRK